MRQYTSNKRSTEQVEFELDGETYHFTPPKVSNLILNTLKAADTEKMELIAMRDQLDWFSIGLADGEADRIWERLNDPDDDLDLDVVQTVARDMVTAASKRPTKRQSDS